MFRKINNQWVQIGGASQYSPPAGAKAYNTVAQSIPHNTTTVVALSAEVFDTNGFRDGVTNPNRMTVPAGQGGRYVIIGQADFTYHATGLRNLHLRKNGTSFVGMSTVVPGSTTNAQRATVATVVDLLPGDYVELTAYQDSGVALDISGSASYPATLTLTRLDGVAAVADGVGQSVGARVTNTVAQSIPSGADTLLSWNSEVFDTNALHDNTTNPSRLTVPPGMGGRWLVIANVLFAANATGRRSLTIRKNGSNAVGNIEEPVSEGALAPTGVLTQTVLDALPGDYFDVTANQYSGAALDVLGAGLAHPFFVAIYLEPQAHTHSLFQAGDGSATAPTYSFGSDPDTGVFRSAADRLSLATAGVERIRVNPGGKITFLQAANLPSVAFSVDGVTDLAQIIGGALWAADGTATSPSHSFLNDTDTGIYRFGPDEIGVSAGGRAKLLVNGAWVAIQPNEATALGQAAGSVQRLFKLQGINMDGANTAELQSNVYRHTTGPGHTTAEITLDRFTDGTHGGALRFRHGTFIADFGQTWFQDGSAASPSISFRSDPDTGIYRADVDVIAMALGGVSHYYFAGAPHQHFRPDPDNAKALGTPSFRWTTVYAVTGTINTSDATLKSSIRDTDLGLKFIQALEPKTYKLEGGSRPHQGLLADQVKEVMETQGIDDFAGYIDPSVTGDEGPKGLRYSEFIPPLIKAVQELAAGVETGTTTDDREGLIDQIEKAKSLAQLKAALIEWLRGR